MIGRLKELRALYTAASPTVRKSIDKARSYAEIVRLLEAPKVTKPQPK